MANRIVLKKGVQQGSAPSASDLVPGELAINTVDAGLFTKLENGNVYTLIPRTGEAIVNNTIGAGLVTAGTFPNGTFTIQNLTVTGTLTATVSAATTATKLSSTRTLALTGDVTGSVVSDLETGFSISTTLGTVGTTKGGTGLTTAPAASQLLVGQADGSFALRTLAAGSNVTITDSEGTLTIASTGGGGGASVTISEEPPAEPSSGDLWWDSNDGQLRIYYPDEDSSQWVDAAFGVVGPQGPPGEPGSGGLTREVRSAFLSPHSYIGTAPEGSSEAAAVWTITRIDVGPPAVTTTATSVAWDDRLTATYT
jgi:hypothetical protein